MKKLLKLNWFKTKKEKSSKFTLSELVWFGFNYTVGITFTAIFASLINSKMGANLGTNMIWILLVEGLIAGTCAWAFARLSRVHSGTNGAAYIYTRSSYGRFWGWLVSFFQYSTLPVIVTSQIVSIIRINFTDPSSFLYANWGVWSNLGLDLIGMGIYGLASCVLFFGMRAFKKFVNVTSYLKWGSSAILMIAAVILFIKAGTSNYEQIYSKQSLTLHAFSKAFISCFFFFLGFETYATIGKNVKNPQKNIGRSIIMVMILSTLFYVVVTILMIGAVSGMFNDNPNLQIFSEFNRKWVEIAGVLIMLTCTISLKANAGMQNALYSGGILEPMAVEGYIAPRFQKLNKDKIPYRAAILNLGITFSLAFVWLIIPDLIQAISDHFHGLANASPVIDYGTITGEASLIMIVIYITIISITLKLSLQKKLKTNKFEFTIWTLAVLFLFWQLIMWFVGVGQGFQAAANDIASKTVVVHAKGIVELTSNILQVTYVTAVIVFAIIWYFAYYRPKLQKRLALGTQKQLDDIFVINDDWSSVSKNMEEQIDSYLVRNSNVNGNTTNDNYKFAAKLKTSISNSINKAKKNSH